jgi:1-acyl-sn-glycerol-3-phosphate acyltransferase
MRWLFYKFTVNLCRCVLAAAASPRVYRRDRAQKSGAWILAANHISHFDPPLISARVWRKLDWMAFAELFSNRFLGTWLTYCDTFPFTRDKADTRTVRTALARLKAGHVVGIYPEGGLRDGSASVLSGAALRPGIGAIAQLAQVPVVPCVILGSDRLYRTANWRPLRRVPVWIGFGEMLPPPPARGASKEDARVEFERTLGEALRALAAEMREHFRLEDRDFPKSPQERMRGE